MPVFAHLGHWYVGLPVYAGPVVLLIAWFKIGDWRDKRRQRRRPPDRGGKRPEGGGST
jgi:hypothetical protein